MDGMRLTVKQVRDITADGGKVVLTYGVTDKDGKAKFMDKKSLFPTRNTATTGVAVNPRPYKDVDDAFFALLLETQRKTFRKLMDETLKLRAEVEKLRTAAKKKVNEPSDEVLRQRLKEVEDELADLKHTAEENARSKYHPLLLDNNRYQAGRDILDVSVLRLQDDDDGYSMYELEVERDKDTLVVLYARSKFRAAATEGDPVEKPGDYKIYDPARRLHWYYDVDFGWTVLAYHLSELGKKVPYRRNNMNLSGRRGAAEGNRDARRKQEYYHSLFGSKSIADNKNEHLFGDGCDGWHDGVETKSDLPIPHGIERHRDGSLVDEWGFTVWQEDKEVFCEKGHLQISSRYEAWPEDCMDDWWAGAFQYRITFPDPPLLSQKRTRQGATDESPKKKKKKSKKEIEAEIKALQAQLQAAGQGAGDAEPAAEAGDAKPAGEAGDGNPAGEAGDGKPAGEAAGGGRSADETESVLGLVALVEGVTSQSD